MKNWMFLLLTLWTMCWTETSPGDETWQQKVQRSLLEKAAAFDEVEMIVVLKDQADLSSTRSLRRKEEKGQTVVDLLQAHAQRTQTSIRHLLDQQGAAYRPFFIFNGLWVKGNARLLEQLARREEVERIEDNPPLSFHRPTAEPLDDVRLRDGIEWGIRRIGADRVWEMGIRGEGAVVAGADTGYDWQHPAISRQYRGNLGTGAVDHNYNWHDAIHALSPLNGDTIQSPDRNPCGLNSRIPCDDHGHGTHTMGIMVGDDGAGNQIGVAPAARWIACRNMERGYGSPATYIECFEWFLAPTDLNGEFPDPRRAPHVINNSWGCIGEEGCNPDNFKTMDKVVQTLRAAGIVVVASAGNSGYKCGSVEDPAAIFADVFSVGATRSNDSIASFSSRGPVVVDGSFRRKPDISAPGVGVRSALPGGNYTSWNGTSMAGPHVAGVVALMISANPELAGQVDLIERIIEETAVPMVDTVACGSIAGNAIPNNTYGYGRINALAAVERARALTNVVDVQAAPQVRLSPNPAKDWIVFGFDNLNGRFTLQVYNATGQQVLRRELSLSGGSQLERVNVSRLPAGVYWYQLQGMKTSLGGKLVVQ